MPASKLPRVGTTIFTVMSRLAAETGAINLGQGFPDFDPPARLRELVAHHLGAGHNQYAPMAGLPALCEAIAQGAARRHGWRIDPAAEVTVTAGGTEAIFAAIHAVVRAGEEVVLLDPSYDSYGPAAGSRAGASCTCRWRSRTSASTGRASRRRSDRARGCSWSTRR
jgi:methionine aminotransferase